MMRRSAHFLRICSCGKAENVGLLGRAIAPCRLESLARVIVLALLSIALLVAGPARLSALAPTHGAIYLGEGKGVLFRIYAPNATAVALAGDFNSWNLTTPIAMHKSGDVWEATVTNAVPYQNYKYVVNGNPAWLRNDPVSLRMENSSDTAASIIENLGNYQWSANESNWQSGAHVPALTQMVIYQMHLKTFMFRNDGVPYAYGKLFRTLVEKKLDYLQQLGINAICFMPLNEFPGDTSWGYNPANWFALESSYGTPSDFQYMVDECHKRGIAVIVDVVYNHLGPSDIASYWDFDGNVQGSIGGNGTWFYTDWRGKTPWGDTEPNWGSGFVRLRLVEAARLFIEDYHCDGLRVDSTVTIRKDAADGYDWNGSDDPNGWSWLQYLNNTIRGYKGGRVVTIAEDIASNTWITKNTGEGGAGFVSQWCPLSPLVSEVTKSWDDDRDMNEVARAIGNTWDVGGQYHQLVKYHSSHDMVDKRNGHYRLPNRIGNPFDWATKARSKLAQGIVIASPGAPMIFMGDEFYAINQWDDDPDHALDWSQLESDRNFWEFSRALFRIKRNHPAMHGNTLEIPVIDHNRKMVAFKRWDGSGDTIMTVSNWRNAEQSVPVYFGAGEDGTWYEILNSDASVFGGGNRGNGGAVTVSGGWANVNTGPYSIVILSKNPDRYPPAKSWYPWSPANGALNTDRTLKLSWRWASDAASYNLFVGTDAAAVASAGAQSAEFKGNQTSTEYDLAGLNSFTTYYWRVDSVNSYGVTKGDVWRFTPGNGDSVANGRAIWTPAAPVAGQAITIRYYPEDGPLQGADSVFFHSGINNWQNVNDLDMSQNANGYFTIGIIVPTVASTLDFVFRTPGNVWDNNNGNDWHVSVTGAPPVVEWSPKPPFINQEMTIIYHADRGTLGGSSTMYIHRGYNEWTQGITDIAMTKTATDTWSHTFTVPATTWQVDFVFVDNPTAATPRWDNNANAAWHVAVEGATPPVDWTPKPPVANATMTITYRAAGRVLAGASAVYIHRGHDGWKNVVHEIMQSTETNVWTYTFQVPAGAAVVDFVFANGPEATATIWDNHSGSDWHVNVEASASPAWGISMDVLSPWSYQGANSSDWGFQLWNAGTGTLTWNLAKEDAGSGVNWFTVAPTSDSSTGLADKKTVAVSFQTSALAAGSYTARIALKDSQSAIADGHVLISLTVRAPNHISATPDSIVVNWPDAPATTTQTTLSIVNTAGGSMFFQARVVNAETTPWLRVSPPSGTQEGPMNPPAAILVDISLAGLARGDYDGMIEIQAANCDNSPVRIPVSLRGLLLPDAWIFY